MSFRVSEGFCSSSMAVIGYGDEDADHKVMEGIVDFQILGKVFWLGASVSAVWVEKLVSRA